MKRTSKITIGATLIALSAISAQTTWADEYMVTVLGRLNTSKVSNHGYAINANGQIAGSSYDLIQNDYPVTVISQGSPLAFLNTNGTMTDLGLLPQTTSSQAFALNDNGQVVGTMGNGNSTSSHAFLYNSGTLTDLGVLPNGDQSFAYGINNSGLIVGDAKLDSTINGITHAFVYRNGAMTDLNSLRNPGTTFTLFSARAVNASGQIAGYGSPALNFSYPHAYLYQNGIAKDLGVLPGATQSRAYAINGAGQVVGSSDAHAFLYANGTMTDIGTLGGKASVAMGINNQGVVVGFSELSLDRDNTTRHAWIYRNGIMTDLTDLVTTSFPFGDGTQTATGVNDSGQIVVTLGPSNSNKNFYGGYGALLLTPLINTVAAPPTGLTAVPTDVYGYGNIGLTWNAAPGAGFYRVFRSTTPGGVHTYLGRTHGELYFTDRGLHAGMTYYYEVVSCNSYGYGRPTPEVASTTQIARPDTPTQVVAKAIDTTHIDVNWSFGFGASKYSVFRSTTLSGPSSYIGQVADLTTYHDSGLQAGTTYYYTVISINNYGQSHPSSAAQATTRLPSFIGVIAKGVGPDQVDLNWGVSIGATSYQIYRGTSSSYHGYVGTTTGTHFSDTKLAPGTTYYYIIIPIAGTVQGPRSNEVLAATLKLPSEATNLAAAPASKSQINLTWTAAIGAASYQIFRATSSGGYHSYIGTTTALRYNNTQLPSHTKYWYVVVSVNQFGQGAKSNEASATTL